MLFSSLPFLLFLAVVVVVYGRLSRGPQNAFLLLASYFFYGYWDWRFLLLLALSTTLDFAVGRGIAATEDLRRKKALVTVSVCANLSILGVFKYYNLFAGSATALFTALGLAAHLPLLKILLPLGISFHVFRSMTYTIDIYRGAMKPAATWFDYALYLAFFPLLLAGPIERARTFLPQLAQRRVISREGVLDGIGLMIVGYFKKVAIADTLAPIADRYFSSPQSFTSGELLSGVYAYTFQIYGDFSGYSDIAKGVATLLGFKVVSNFNAPYFSRNVTEFWRRWHISLSSWLKDYLYVSLGGNRRGRMRTSVNLFLTMLLGGLWHGAAWTFVGWGAAHGLYLVIHKYVSQGAKPSAVALQGGWARLSEVLKIAVTFHIVAFTWIAFKAQDFVTLRRYVDGLLGFQSLSRINGTVLLGCALMVILDVAQARAGREAWLLSDATPRPVRYLAAQVLVVCTVAAAVAHVNTVTPFIYFQF